MNGLIKYSDAHDLQCASTSYDMVVNVESSHFYADPKKFVQEVARVLKPGGYFCWCDIGYSKEVGLFYKYKITLFRTLITCMSIRQ